MTHLRRTALWTGIAYLGIVLCGLFAELVVRGSLIVPDDANATAANISSAPGFFQLGVGADFLMIALDVRVAFGLYRLFRSVDRRLAIAAMVFRLVQASILAVNLLNLTHALELALGSEATQSLAALETHAHMYDVGLIAFGLACLTLSRLLQRADAPRWLALGMLATGVVYLTGSFIAVWAPDRLPFIEPFYVIAIVAEPAMAVWLIVRGRSGHSLSSNTTSERSIGLMTAP